MSRRAKKVEPGCVHTRYVRQYWHAHQMFIVGLLKGTIRLTCEECEAEEVLLVEDAEQTKST